MNQLTTKIDKQFLGRLCADAISNLERACEKHPTFPNEFTSIPLETAQEMMWTAKHFNDNGHPYGDTIAEEEGLEFTVALIQGMRPQAYDELVDLITVWLRVGLHLNDYVPREVKS